MKNFISDVFVSMLSVVVLSVPLDAVGNNRLENTDYDRRSNFKETEKKRTKMLRILKRNIKLTKGQREKIKVLRVAFDRDMVRLRANTRLKRIALRELMEKTNPEITKIRAQATAVSKAQGRMFERGVVIRAEIKTLLTADQKRMYESVREKRNDFRDSRVRWWRGTRDHRDKP